MELRIEGEVGNKTIAPMLLIPFVENAFTHGVSYKETSVIKVMLNVEQGKNAELVQLKQNEIAQQWDTIEYVVQNDSFWYFISNDTPPSTRIDFIFDLLEKMVKK